jgi:hypothetical protein
MNQIRVFIHHRTGPLGQRIGPALYGFAEPPREVGMSEPPWRQATLVLRRAEVRVPAGSDVVPDWARGVTLLRWSLDGLEHRDDAAAVLAHADAGRFGFGVVA